MNSTDRQPTVTESLSRRTAMAGFLGTALGSAFGYDQFLRVEEPTFAASLEFNAADVTIQTNCGIVTEAVVAEESTIAIDYANVPDSVLTDGYRFQFTLEANPHVDGRADRAFAGWSEPNDHAPTDLGAVLDGMDGAGSASDPYVITTDHELQAIAAALDAHYELGNNIDATQTGAWNNGSGFDPLTDTDADEAFEGTLTGNGHRICGLTIDGDDDGVGLIGVNAGTVDHVGLIHSDVQGPNAVGTIAGLNIGTIDRSYALDCTVQGAELVGGLVGANVREEGETEQGHIDRSYAECSVTGDRFTGGFVGLNVADTRDAYARGTIDGDAVIGGFAGANALGEGEDAGLIGSLLELVIGVLDGLLSLVGLGGDDIEETGVISDAYATVAVPDHDNAAGFVAVNETDRTCLLFLCIGGDPGDLDRTYWDTDASGTAVGLIEANGDEDLNGLSTSELQGAAASANTALDFTDTWTTVTDPDDYPHLLDTPVPHDGGTTPSGGSTTFEPLVDAHSVPATDLLDATDLPHGTLTPSFTDLNIDTVSLSAHSAIDPYFTHLEPTADAARIDTAIEFTLTVELGTATETIATATAGPATATLTVDVD
ncbi:hypothetical protein [Natrialba taiwanensis]|uniref:GLUG domain-containing protein n=1 Tax=Natrialba taiwanensis DSM 12281 TaxID=1230458 RepID=L9ZF91_9EURY|nr:hypothetical protein [Natrialba taiwanensis]ELY85110.1 GLUG domain-containing protein [Natrialba taiwanensis DSM 12281]